MYVREARSVWTHQPQSAARAPTMPYVRKVPLSPWQATGHLPFAPTSPTGVLLSPSCTQTLGFFVEAGAACSAHLLAHAKCKFRTMMVNQLAVIICTCWHPGKRQWLGAKQCQPTALMPGGRDRVLAYVYVCMHDAGDATYS
jgi:hypothetical protein